MPGPHSVGSEARSVAPARPDPAGATGPESARRAGADPAPPARGAGSDGDEPTDRPWRRSLRAAGFVWLVTHVGYGVITFFAFFQSGEKLPGSVGAAFGRWSVNWDARWFVWIAEHGYVFDECNRYICAKDSAAFFPLYPVLIRVVSVVTGNVYVAAWIIAVAAQLGAFAILHRLVESEFDRSTASRTLWYMVVFPTGFYLGITYNASLFLLLVLGSVYLMRRGTWWGAALLGGLATATRSSALLLFVPFCYEYLRQHDFRLRNIRWDVAWAALIPTGIASFVVYCWVVLGDPLRFMAVQAHWGWERGREWPWVGIYRTVKIIFTSPNILGNDARNLVDLGAVLFVSTMLVLAFVGPWKLRRDQWFLPVFGIATVLFIISFPADNPINRVPLLSAARLSLEAFPAFLMAARIGSNPKFDRFYTFVCLPLQGLWMSHFLLIHFIG